MLIDELGIERVNALIASLGLTRTALRRRMLRTDLSARGEENVSTPAEAASVMVRLARCEVPVSPQQCRRVREILELPKDDAVRETIPANIRVTSKPGWLEGARTWWAVVEVPDRPFALAVMATYARDDDEAKDVVRRVAALAVDYFTRLGRATPYGVRVPLDAIQGARKKP
jgi:beta-lactamase class A